VTDTTIGDAPSGASASSTELSVSEQATNVKEQVSDMKEKGRLQLREQLDERTTQAGQGMRSFAGALRRSGSDVQDESGGASVSRVTEGVADRVERAGSYLEGASGDDLLRDAEDFARRQPWVVAAAAAAVGFAASRLLKASSESRYSTTSNGGSPARTSWQPARSDRGQSESGWVEPATVVSGSGA
jgi:ElaB/YqjD/DUF883 family membrane-anchored ribosome-binding protein